MNYGSEALGNTIVSEVDFLIGIGFGLAEFATNNMPDWRKIFEKRVIYRRAK